MKKTLVAVIAMLMTCAVGAYALDLVTAQDAHKTGLEGMRTKINAVINQLNGTGISSVQIHLTTNDYLEIVGTNFNIVHGGVTNVLDADLTTP